MEIIIITGTPGCGKTTISKEISQLEKSEYISLNELVVKKGFHEDYDKKRDTYIADFDKMIPYIIKIIEKAKEKKLKYFFIEGHFADIIPKKFIDLVIILRCHPDILRKRLEKRDYKESKIRENLQAEILGNSTNYILEKDLKCPIYEINTSNKSIDSIIKTITDIINNGEPNLNPVGKIDWLCELSKKNRLNEFFD
ncbi:MAG: adenylate kinase family protein [Promethearchaeati archaeon]